MHRLNYIPPGLFFFLLPLNNSVLGRMIIFTHKVIPWFGSFLSTPKWLSNSCPLLLLACPVLPLQIDFGGMESQLNVNHKVGFRPSFRLVCPLNSPLRWWRWSSASSPSSSRSAFSVFSSSLYTLQVFNYLLIRFNGFSRSNWNSFLTSNLKFNLNGFGSSLTHSSLLIFR